MSDDTEQMVRDLLHDSARRSQVPLPELATIAWEARRETRRARGRRVLVGAAAAVLVGILAVLPWSFGGDQSMPVRPLPSGPTTTSDVLGTLGDAATLTVGGQNITVTGERDDDGWTAVVVVQPESISRMTLMRVPADSAGTLSASGVAGETVMLLAAPDEPRGLAFAGGVRADDAATVSVPGTPLSLAAVLLDDLPTTQPYPSATWRDPFGGERSASVAGTGLLTLPGRYGETGYVRGVLLERDSAGVRVGIQVPGGVPVDPPPLVWVHDQILPAGADSAFSGQPQSEVVWGLTRERPGTADLTVTTFGPDAVERTEEVDDVALVAAPLADDLWLVGVNLSGTVLRNVIGVDSVRWTDTSGNSHVATINP